MNGNAENKTELWVQPQESGPAVSVDTPRALSAFFQPGFWSFSQLSSLVVTGVCQFFSQQ